MEATRWHLYAAGYQKIFMCLGILGLCLLTSGFPAVAADCTGSPGISQTPLAAMQSSAPAIIMFCVDDSGSMDWETITPEYDGTFNASSNSDGGGYVFDNPGDNNYSNSYYIPSSERVDWQSQWSGYNSLYYNPSVYYAPWPTLSPADPDNPRSNPVNASPTFNLSSTFMTWAYGSGGTVVGTATGFQDTGTWSSSSGGYNNGTYYTSTSACKATWTASDLSPTQTYDVYVWYEGGRGYSTAQYAVGSTTVNVNQRYNSGQWVQIASNQTFSSGTGTVSMSFTPSSYYYGTQTVSADSVRFLPTGGTPITIPNAHYFVQNSSGTFLVTVDSQLSYYKVTTGTMIDSSTGNSLSIITGLTPATTAEIATITAGTYAQGDYTKERQNFANWYSYYRRRMFTAIGAIANVITTMSNVEIGLYTINDNNGVRTNALPVKATINGTYTDDTSQLLTLLYKAHANGSTPLREGLITVGDYLMGINANGTTGTGTLFPSSYPTNTDSTSYPYFTSENGGSCQQAFIIVTTDGYYNDDLSSNQYNPPSQLYTKMDANIDGDNCGNWNCGKFGDEVSGSLADIAMYYYETDLNTSLANDVPTNAYDSNTAQHAVTYTFSFGLTGTLDPASYSSCPSGDCPTWPTFNPDDGLSDPEKTDDLWHAAINGRGQYLSASSPQDVVNALLTFKQNIQNRIGSAASLSANSVSLQTGTVIYQGTYNSSNWFGDLVAEPVDPVSGAIGSPQWSAANQLSTVAWNQRIIFTSTGGSGIPFEYDSLSAAQQADLSSNATTAKEMVQALRGDPEYSTSQGGPFRTLSGPLGDIVHCAPVNFNNVVYVGANDGMLHAFDASTGSELFAFVPNLVFPNLNLLTSPTYSHQYYVDNTPYIQNIGTSASPEDILVDGLSGGGKGYFCLDVTNPNPSTESQAAGMFLWQYPADGTTDNDMGYSYSRAYIVDTKAAGWVVIFGNGYDSVNGEAVLYVLNPTTGALIDKIHTGVSNCNGLSTPAAIDVDGDGYIDYVYAGDLQGDLWKFDFTGATVSSWKVAFANGNTPEPLFKAVNASGQVQPITVSPDVMSPCDPSVGGYMVLFGTGQYLGTSDLSDTTVQSLYGIWDWSAAWVKQQKDPTGLYYGSRNADGTLSNLVSNSNLTTNANGLTLLQQTPTTYSGNYIVFSDNAIAYYNPQTDTGTNVGWYVDLPESGERLTQDPSIRNGVGVFVSTIPSGTPCSPGGTSVVYMLDACTGGRAPNPQFDLNGDKQVNGLDILNLGNGQTAVPSAQTMSSMLYAPLELGGSSATFLLFNSSSGTPTEEAVPSIPAGVTYWMKY